MGSAGLSFAVVSDPRIPQMVKAQLGEGWYPGLLIKKKREELKWSQGALVEAVNRRLEDNRVSPYFTLERLGQYEGGQIHISSKDATDLSVVLDIPVKQFFLGPQENTVPTVLAISQT